MFCCWNLSIFSYPSVLTAATVYCTVCMYIWSRKLVNFNRERTWEQQGLAFVTRVYWTWTMCAQWAGKLMTAYIWRLYTCSVKDVTLLLGTVEHWWLKQKRTKHCYSTAGTFKYIFDSSTTSTHFTVLRIFHFLLSLLPNRLGLPW